MRQLTFIAIGLLVLLFLHLLGMEGWYYAVKFYDKFLHFLAGVVVSATIFFILTRPAAKELIKAPKIFYSVFTFTAMVTVGVGWEFFEFFFLPDLQLGVSDTLFDLFWMGVGSGLINIVLNIKHGV